MDKLKENVIRSIEELYPPDSEYDDTAEIGQRFLLSAVMNKMDWRELPLNVLIEMNQFCIRLENSK